VKGSVKVFYKVLCDSEKDVSLPLSELLANANIKKAIKSAYSNGRKNIVVSASEDVSVLIEPEREIFELVIAKDDIQDMITLCEDDAKKRNKRKKGCERIEIIDFETLD
jgi:hypothetical protein